MRLTHRHRYTKGKASSPGQEGKAAHNVDKSFLKLHLPFTQHSQIWLLHDKFTQPLKVEEGVNGMTCRARVKENVSI